MADESLNLHDNMSPGLKRIADQAARMYREFTAMKRSIGELQNATLPKSAIDHFKQLGLKATEAKRRVQELQRAINSGAMLPGGRYGLPRVNGKFQSTAGVTYPEGGKLQYADSVIEGRWLKKQRAMEREISTLQAIENIKKRNFSSEAIRQRFEQRYGWGSYRGHQNLRAMNSGAPGKPLEGAFLRNLSRTAISLYALGAAAGAVFSVFTQMVAQKDALLSMRTRLSLVNDGSQSNKSMVNDIYGIANRSRADVDGTASLYNRIATSGVKTSNKEIAGFVEHFNKSMVISGTGAQENKAVMLQIAQAMGSNRLGGDEFRSIAEQAPIFKAMLAKGLNVNPGALKKMGSEGKLTARVILAAFKKTGPEIDKIFEKMPWTVGQIGQVIQNKWTQQLDKNLSSWNAVSDAAKQFVQWMDTAEGNQFFKDLFKSINQIVADFVKLIQVISPVVRWLVKHFQMILTIIGAVLFRMVAIKTLIMTGIIPATGELNTAMPGGLGTSNAWVLGVVLYFAMLQKIWQFADNASKFTEQTESGITAGQKQREHTRIREQEAAKLGDPDKYKGGPSKWWTALNTNTEKRWAPVEAKFDKLWGKNPNKISNIAGRDPLDDIKGMMDPTKNKDINTVGEVKKIGSDLTISEDSLKWMRALAEREWVIKNETINPQVTMHNHITKDVDPDKVIDRLADRAEKWEAGRVSTKVG